MTKIYFAPSEFPDASDFVVPETGERYMFKLEMEEDQLRLVDGVGRFVPFDYDQLQALVLAVLSANELLEASDYTSNYMQNVVNYLNARAGVHAQ